MTTALRCCCGTPLSRFNEGDLCSICEPLKVLRVDDLESRLRFAARHVAGVYARPHDFKTPAGYLDELSCVLDDLCDAVNLPKLHLIDAEWSGDA